MTNKKVEPAPKPQKIELPDSVETTLIWHNAKVEKPKKSGIYLVSRGLVGGVSFSVYSKRFDMWNVSAKPTAKEAERYAFMNTDKYMKVHFWAEVDTLNPVFKKIIKGE